MKALLEKNSILKKTAEVGGNTLLSRIFGLVREILLMHYLGIGVLADGFTTAFMLPNSLRKIFAEGALTAAFVPSFITIFKKEGKDQANSLTTLCFVFFESALLLFCVFVMWKASATIRFITPGYSEDQVAATVPALRILMPFIFFISTSALLSGALNSVNHFFVPAFSPVLLNSVFIIALLCCTRWALPVEYLCWAVVLGGFVQCLLHIYAYYKEGFSFEWWNAKTLVYFSQIVGKFILCFLSMSVMEVNLFIDQRFASFLTVGSVTLLKYANRFMGIPLGVFAVAFSTILLPHFTRLKMETPEKLNFYLAESVKFVLWITIPVALLMGFFSTQIFQTLFASVSSHFPAEKVFEAGTILIGFLVGLCFFSLNKVLFNLFYSFHDTRVPMFISVVATVFNIIGNYYLVDSFGGFGLALATSLSGVLQTILALGFLAAYHNLSLSLSEVGTFLFRYVIQLFFVLLPLYYIYPPLYRFFAELSYGKFLTKSFGFWLWAGPLCLLVLVVLYLTKRMFGVKLYFLD